MNIWKWVIFSVIVLVIGWGLYSLIIAKNELSSEVSKLSAQFSNLQAENRNLLDQIDYLKNPANLVNKLKEQTSYRLPDEKLIIVVPGATSTASTSSATSTR